MGRLLRAELLQLADKHPPWIGDVRGQGLPLGPEATLWSWTVATGTGCTPRRLNEDLARVSFVLFWQLPKLFAFFSPVSFLVLHRLGLFSFVFLPALGR